MLLHQGKPHGGKEVDNLSEQECQMLECIREHGKDDLFRLTIEREDGEWTVALDTREAAKPVARGHGRGKTFEQAWDDVGQPLAFHPRLV
jgi:hypothetical protein